MGVVKKYDEIWWSCFGGWWGEKQNLPFSWITIQLQAANGSYGRSSRYWRLLGQYLTSNQRCWELMGKGAYLLIRFGGWWSKKENEMKGQEVTLLYLKRQPGSECWISLSRVQLMLFEWRKIRDWRSNDRLRLVNNIVAPFSLNRFPALDLWAVGCTTTLIFPRSCTRIGFPMRF